MKYSRPGGISMVEKPPLHTYDIYLEVEAHGGHGGIWRPFYLSPICNVWTILLYNMLYMHSTKLFNCTRGNVLVPFCAKH